MTLNQLKHKLLCKLSMSFIIKLSSFFHTRCYYCEGPRMIQILGWKDVILKLHGKKYYFHYRCFEFCFKKINITMKQRNKWQ